MIRFFSLLAVFSLTVPSICNAQDTKAKEELISAIERLSKRDVSLVGSIDEEMQEQPVAVDNAGGPQRVVIRGMPFGALNEYRGEVEVLVAKNSELVIVSKEELPGVNIFKSGDVVLCQQMHLEEPLGTTKLTSNVSKLVDWNALANAVESAKEIQSKAKGKDSEFRVVLDRSFLPNEIPQAVPAMPAGIAVAGNKAQNAQIRIGGNPMAPTIVELIATFRLSAAKEIIGLEYALQYNDPIRGFAVNAGAAGGVVQFKVKPEGQEDLGKLIVYDFDVVAKPTDKLNAFVNQAKTMLKDRK